MTALFEPGRSYELNPAVAPCPEPAAHVPARPCDSSPLAAVP